MNPAYEDRGHRRQVGATPLAMRRPGAQPAGKIQCSAPSAPPAAASDESPHQNLLRCAHFSGLGRRKWGRPGPPAGRAVAPNQTPLRRENSGGRTKPYSAVSQCWFSQDMLPGRPLVRATCRGPSVPSTAASAAAPARGDAGVPISRSFSLLQPTGEGLWGPSAISGGHYLENAPTDGDMGVNPPSFVQGGVEDGLLGGARDVDPHSLWRGDRPDSHCGKKTGRDDAVGQRLFWWLRAAGASGEARKMLEEGGGSAVPRLMDRSAFASSCRLFRRRFLGGACEITEGDEAEQLLLRKGRRWGN